MRLLVIPPVFPTADSPVPGIFILRQVQALLKRGHEVSVLRIVPYAPPILPKWKAYSAIPQAYTYESVAVRTIRALVPPRKIALGFVRRQVISRITAEIRRFNPDVIHAHFLIPPGFMVMNLDRPVVLTAHGSDAHTEIWQRRDLYHHAVAATRSATVVTAVSEFVRMYILRLGRSDAEVIYNGADDTVFYPSDRAAARHALNIDMSRLVLAFAGSVARAKGVFDLALAARGLGDIAPLILVAGHGPDMMPLSRKFKEFGVEARLLGTLSQSELAHLLAACDAFVLPSYAEGLPSVVCEAMLAGRAVVASAVGGVPEILKHRQTGITVPPGDPGALSSALREILTDAQLRNQIADNAHAFASKNLTWSVNAAAYECVYREAALRFRNRSNA